MPCTERVLRRLRLEWKSFVDHESAGKALAGKPWTSRSETLARLQGIAHSSGLADDLISHVDSGLAHLECRRPASKCPANGGKVRWRGVFLALRHRVYNRSVTMRRTAVKK